MMQNGICYLPINSMCPKSDKDFSLSPIDHYLVNSRYFIKMPSMIRAIKRGWMSKVQSQPTLTTKVIDRAPCPYWETSLGPRYLTESEAETMMGYPIGWTDLNVSETP